MGHSDVVKKRMAWFEIAFIMLFSAYYILPSSRDTIGYIIPIVAGLVYILYVFFKDKRMGIIAMCYILAVLFLSIAYMLLTDKISTEVVFEYVKLKEFVAKFNQYFCLYLPLFFLGRVVKKCNFHQKKFILIFTMVLFAYVVIQTLHELSINPNAIRQWALFDELDDDNVGNYYFVYSVPILIVGIAVCIPKIKLYQKIIAIAGIVFLFYFVIKSQYTLALLISIIGVVIQIFLSIKKPLLKGVFLFAVILGMFAIPSLLKFASTNVDSAQMATRFNELYIFFTSGDSSGYNLNGRLMLYRKTIAAFIESPIIGNRYLDFDGHATCLTILADTGIIGGIPFYYMLISAWIYVKKIIGENNIKFFSVYLCLLLMGFTNPIHTSLPLAFIVWFVVPLAISMVFKKKKAKQKI